MPTKLIPSVPSTQCADLPPLADAMTAADLARHAAAIAVIAGLPADKVYMSIGAERLPNETARVFVDLPKSYQLFRGAAWPEAVRSAHEWAALQGPVERNAIVRRMALAIIGITDEYGSCSESALIRAGFGLRDIEHYGADACQRASEMAGNAPFSIIDGGV